MIDNRALAFKTIGRGFAHRQHFGFFTCRRRRRVSIYQSYYGREETKENRSEWCGGRALAFKTIGRGFAPRQHFGFFTRRRRRRVSIYQSYIGGLPPASALSFSHVDVTKVGVVWG